MEFADLVYLRSDLYVREQRLRDPAYEPPVPPLSEVKDMSIGFFGAR